MKYIFKFFILLIAISLSSFSFAKQSTRAPRTDAPAPNSPIEPVPPFVCDLTQIDRLLAQIKNEVTITNNALACSTVTAITGPTIITTPGSYCLKESFVFNSGDGIVINANDVRLNLNQNIISGNGLGDNGIVVNGSNVFIHDGFINSVVGDAIQIGNGQTKVVVENVTVDPSTNGFALRGISGSPVTNCIIDSCNLVGTSTAITILFGQNNTVKNCNIAQATGAGVLIDHGSNNSIRDSVIHDFLSFDGAESTTVAGIFTGSSEQQCQIIGCNISDILATGSAHPYGILFTNTLETIVSVTGNFHGNTLLSVDWSPDGRYVAVGGLASGIDGFEIRVYEFNGTSLTPVATAQHGNTVISVDWSPDGRYLAIGGVAGTGGFEIRVYQFDGTSLTQVATAVHGDAVTSVNWSPDGRYLAIGGVAVASIGVRVFEFTGSSLVQVANAIFVTVATSVSSAWTVNGHFLAVGGVTGTGSEVRVYSFNGTALTLLDSKTHGAGVASVNWSPDDRFLAIGGVAGTGGFEIRVYSFDGATLTDIIDVSHGATVQSVNWSPDGLYLAIAGVTSVSDGVEVRVYIFNGTSLVEQSTFIHGNTLFSINWSPTGLFLAIDGAALFGFDVDVRVISGLTFAQGSIIRNNQISNINGGLVLGPGFPRGRCLSASSGSNLIIQNTAFDGDINYEFVTNVFRQFIVNVNSTVPNDASNLSYPPL